VTGRLKCSATGDPAPTLFWIQPNGRTTKYSPSTASPVGLGSPAVAALAGAVEDGARRTDGVLTLGGPPPTASDSSSAPPLTGMYICVANNEAGNVTLAVNISWPTAQLGRRRRPTADGGSLPADLRDLLLDLPLDEEHSLAANFTTGTEEEWLRGRRRRGEEGSGRLFSVAELVCAVVVTHVATLLIVLALVAAFVHRRAVRRHRQQQLLPPVLHATAPPAPTTDPDPGRLLRCGPTADPLPVGSMYRHNGFQLPGLTGRTTPYANDGLYETGTIRSGFSYTAASNRR